MKIRINSVLWAAAVAVLCSAAKVQAVEEMVMPAEKLQFVEAVPGASRAVISGDPAASAFTGIVKFAPGVKHGLHTHTSDTKLVIISGKFTYAKEGEAEMPYGPASVLVIPGGLKHSSGSDPVEGCTFYEEWSGKFDMMPVQTPPPAEAPKKKRNSRVS